MKEHTWKMDSLWVEYPDKIHSVYINELGEKHEHVIESNVLSSRRTSYDELRTCCWDKCSGNRPDCLTGCPILMAYEDLIDIFSEFDGQRQVK